MHGRPKAERDITGNPMAELWRQRRILFGTLIGLIAGAASTLAYSLGSFMPALQADFGWSRGQASLASLGFALSVVLTGPVWGSLADRMGARTVTTISLAGYAIGLGMLPLVAHGLLGFCTIYFIVVSLGVGATPVTLLKPIADSFRASRGIAIGIVFAGLGLAAFWVPRLVTELVGLGGWRLGYWGLATIAALAAPIVWLTLPDAGSRGQSSRFEQSALEGLTMEEARATRQFWLLLAIAGAMSLGLAGLVIHLVPIFIDLHASPSEAAATASFLGLSSITGRLCIGFALDRMRGPLVAFCVMIVGCSGAALLYLFGLPVGMLAALLIGFAFGAEVDIIAYFTSRYLGRKAYSAIFGRMYAVVAIGSGSSTYLLGVLRDVYGSYDLALIAAIVATFVAGILTFFLGAYRFQVG